MDLSGVPLVVLAPGQWAQLIRVGKCSDPIILCADLHGYAHLVWLSDSRKSWVLPGSPACQETPVNGCFGRRRKLHHLLAVHRVISLPEPQVTVGSWWLWRVLAYASHLAEHVQARHHLLIGPGLRGWPRNPRIDGASCHYDGALRKHESSNNLERCLASSVIILWPWLRGW